MRLWEFIKAHYKALLVGVVVLALAITGIIIGINAAKSARINILVTPIDAVIKIDGRRYKNGSHRVFPGKKHVEISREGMNTLNFDIDCVSGHTVALNRYLNAGEDDFSFYRKSAESYEILKLIADEKASNFINNEEQKLTITDLLPIVEMRKLDKKYAKDGQPYIETQIKNATHDEKCEASICLEIITNADDPEKTVRNILKAKGYNLDDYEVFYD